MAKKPAQKVKDHVARLKKEREARILRMGLPKAHKDTPMDRLTDIVADLIERVEELADDVTELKAGK